MSISATNVFTQAFKYIALYMASLIALILALTYLQYGAPLQQWQYHILYIVAAVPLLNYLHIKYSQ
jgi:hypothetical protein